MIHFQNIQWRNFLSYGDYFTEVQLDASKLNLLSATNGIGKCVRASTKVDIDFEDEETRRAFLDYMESKGDS